MDKKNQSTHATCNMILSKRLNITNLHLQMVNSSQPNQPNLATRSSQNKPSIMTHSLTPAAVAPTIPPSQKPPATCTHRNLILRRDVLVGTVFGLSVVVGEKSADAAARRPPPPPPTEKKDPNVSGVLAKVIASKKRKEAMKESIAQLRNKGKLIDNVPSPASAPAPE